MKNTKLIKEELKINNNLIKLEKEMVIELKEIERLYQIKREYIAKKYLKGKI